MNKLELGNQPGQNWENWLLELFEDEMRAPSSAQPLMANPFVRTAGQLMFTCSFAGVALEALTSWRKDATCFLRWIMSKMADTTVQACSQKGTENEAMERRVSLVILNVYQSTGIAKGDGWRQSLENHGKLDETRRFSNKKFGEDHDVHRNMALAED